MRLSTNCKIIIGFLAALCCLINPLAGQEMDICNIQSVRTKVGAAFPSTGTEQKSPQLVNVTTIAPDVLCIEVDACRILPSMQIPYQKDLADILTVVHSSSLGEENAKPGSDMGERLNKECTPKGSGWPSTESYFDVYGWDLENEYVGDRNLGPSAYIWGYMAARK
jgi:hypothetical protein